MGILSFFKTHIIGHNVQVTKLSPNILFFFTVSLCKIIIFIFLYYLTYFIHMFLASKINSKIFLSFRRIYINFWKTIPICGIYKIKLLDDSVQFLLDFVLPRLQNLISVWELFFNVTLIDQLFGNKETVPILFTEKSEEFKIIENNILVTTLIISNHRSINDYILIYHLIYEQLNSTEDKFSKATILKQLWFENDISKYNNLLRIRFIGWGNIFKLIQVEILKDIAIKDENSKITSKSVLNLLKKNGNEIMIVFPEVNILTTELGMMQRKINENYSPFVSKFYNVLYPRFNTFVNIIVAFQEFFPKKHAKRSIFHRDKLIKVTDSLNKKVATRLNTDDKTDNWVVNGHDKTELIKLSDTDVQMNQFMYDFTIIYYRVKYTNDGHDHDKGNLKVHRGIQLEQIAPSLIELMFNNISTVVDPIIVMIDIRKHELPYILNLKPKKLERWLELQWLNKEQLIKTNECNVVLK
ncbi:similar to Saccharomyces cerevisiae YOR298W MUM3 Protein of unknown function involved in the organization of the outer spore wall layers [Maudiozyma saulgeensis]|uniref:Uncharacterized protein n=1 Tax=Maudiozyma saulgeensis TaxID=1789683 RepID=A0A1X7R4L0_9SACH|nr:similar to Saccharomyces cerevisiae YOR298W MUM3 Protein of unknown function involved in the organization of the outer spore wall layers [Kazachstania saulgeensis]